MKKTIALFGSLLILAGTKSKAQTPSQLPVKKETVKPTGTAPKTDAQDTFLKLGTLKGETSASGASKNAPLVNPKSVNPTFVKGAASSPNNSVAQHHNPPPASNSVAPRHNH